MPKVPSKGSSIRTAVFIDRKPTTYNTKFKAGALVDVAAKINNDGLPVLMNHNSSRFPIGMWFKAKVNEAEQTVAQFYIPAEIPEHNDTITRIDTGILDSVSIGFTAGSRTCSICGHDIHDYENCPHIPGKTYGNEICYVELDDVKASEGSLVYSGAVAAAKIQEDYMTKSDSLSKEALCKEFPTAFSTGELEIVQTGVIIQDTDDNFDEGSIMKPEEIQELQNKFAAQASTLADTSTKYAAVVEELAATRTEIAKVDEYKVQAETAAQLAEAAKTDLNTLITKFQTVVTSLAAPFKADYEAPTGIESLIADFDKYMEETKALPSGRQSEQENTEVLGFTIPDTAYKL